jgi:hypothetical protein
MAMNDYFSSVHSISGSILGVTVDDDLGTIHESTQIITGSAEYVNFDGSAQICADVSLPIDIL